jgi:phospholipid/cholesterol/gamma-HCH transport system ATP-binding protein
MIQPAVELLALAFHTGQGTLFTELNLTFFTGRCSVLMGPAGCGKSTLLKIAAGLIIPTAGRAIFEGLAWDSAVEEQVLEARKRSGFVFQNAALWANKSVWQNIELPLVFHNPKMEKSLVEEKVRSAGKKVGLREIWQERPSHLSLGEQKLVSFARAIVHDPQVLFLDDPTAGIDSQLKEKLLGLIEDFRNQGKTIILVTQDPTVTARVADDLAVMKNGKILAQGTLSEVARNPDPEVIDILTAVLSQAATFSGDILDLLSNSS